MNPKPSPYLVLTLLLTLGFTLALWLEAWFSTWQGNRANAPGLLAVALGDSRRLVADEFFTEADVYFHSGFYPSMFDAARGSEKAHVAEAASGAGETATGEQENFLGKPRDWIDRFGRNFFPTVHTHLKPENVDEILPWLEFSADLDPHRIETYVVTAYWLRRIHRPRQAERFLRQGRRANPNSPQILFALGQLYDTSFKDPNHARNLWELALRRWRQQQQAKPPPDKFVLEEITTRLAGLEAAAGHYAKAIGYLDMAKRVSPAPEKIQEQIDQLRKKQATDLR